MCVRCDLDDAIADQDWERLALLADDLRNGRLDPDEGHATGAPRWPGDVTEAHAWQQVELADGFGDEPPADAPATDTPPGPQEATDG